MLARRRAGRAATRGGQPASWTKVASCRVCGRGDQLVGCFGDAEDVPVEEGDGGGVDQLFGARDLGLDALAIVLEGPGVAAADQGREVLGRVEQVVALLSDLEAHQRVTVAVEDVHGLTLGRDERFVVGTGEPGPGHDDRGQQAWVAAHVVDRRLEGGGAAGRQAPGRQVVGVEPSGQLGGGVGAQGQELVQDERDVAGLVGNVMQVGERPLGGVVAEREHRCGHGVAGLGPRGVQILELAGVAGHAVAEDHQRGRFGSVGEVEPCLERAAGDLGATRALGGGSGVVDEGHLRGGERMRPGGAGGGRGRRDGGGWHDGGRRCMARGVDRASAGGVVCACAARGEEGESQQEGREAGESVHRVRLVVRVACLQISSPDLPLVPKTCRFTCR